MALHTYIDTIPHRQQRYPTVGDYWRPAVQRTGLVERTEIRVSELGNEDYEFLISIHEQIEEYLTRKRGISEKVITAFDIAYETARQEGDDSEPGDAPDAPYRAEHQFATSIEKQLAIELGVNWFEYNEAINNLFEPAFSSCTTSSTGKADEGNSSTE